MNAITEKDASTKWCPFARVLLPINQAGNRIGTFHKTLTEERDRKHYEQQEADCNCLGSRCMAWRWIENPSEPVPDNYGGVRFGNGTGYCALAGRPE